MTNNKLYSLEQIEAAISDCETNRKPQIIMLQTGGVYLGDALRQLADTMRENEVLKEEIRKYVEQQR